MTICSSVCKISISTTISRIFSKTYIERTGQCWRAFCSLSIDKGQIQIQIQIYKLCLKSQYWLDQVQIGLHIRQFWLAHQKCEWWVTTAVINFIRPMLSSGLLSKSQSSSYSAVTGAHLTKSSHVTGADLRGPLSNSSPYWPTAELRTQTSRNLSKSPPRTCQPPFSCCKSDSLFDRISISKSQEGYHITIAWQPNYRFVSLNLQPLLNGISISIN